MEHCLGKQTTKAKEWFYSFQGAIQMPPESEQPTVRLYQHVQLHEQFPGHTFSPVHHPSPNSWDTSALCHGPWFLKAPENVSGWLVPQMRTTVPVLCWLPSRLLTPSASSSHGKFPLPNSRCPWVMGRI